MSFLGYWAKEYTQTVLQELGHNGDIMTKIAQMVLLGVLILTSCSQEWNETPNIEPPQIGEILLMCGPPVQFRNYGEDNNRYLVTSRVRWKENDTYVNGRLVYWDVSDQTYGVELGQGSFSTVSAIDMYFNNGTPTIGSGQGFAWYGIESLNYQVDETIQIAYSSVETGPDDKFFNIIYQDDGELTYIMDGNDRRYHQRYNEHFPTGDEIPGDALDDLNYYNSFFSSDLDVDRKDLILELDVHPDATDIWNIQSAITSRLVEIFEEIEINLIILWENTSIDRFDSYYDDMDFDEAMDCLYRERNYSGYDRKALHIVVSEIPPAYDLSSIAYGYTVSFFDDQYDSQNTTESECYARLYKHEESLDSVGCIIFLRTFDSYLERDGGGGNPWSLTEAFCWTTAHEIGHALGIYNPEHIAPGNIMSHDLGGFDQRGYQLEFMHFKYQNYQDNSHDDDPDLNANSNCICIRDILGVHTLSIASGWQL
jgi:hypothetical protein